jgi:hypothetical protein
MAEIEDRIAKLLALAFRTESPDEALNALAQAKRTLAKSGRDIHDVLSAPKLYGGLAEWVAEMAARKQAKEERQKAEMEAKRWARKRGVDPWLTDDDPLWAEWADAESRKTANAAERKRKAEEEDRKRRAAWKAKWEAEAAEREARNKAKEKEQRKLKEKREEAGEEAADALAEPAFYVAIALFRARAKLPSANRKFVEGIYNKATRQAYGSPLRAFRAATTEVERARIRELFATIELFARTEVTRQCEAESEL